jgi:cellulose synthase/poly-beta-1,6-N-acetylglucosamine synthase-like glycosyltransferase
MSTVGIDSGVMFIFLFISLYFEVFLLLSFLVRRTGRGAVIAGAHCGREYAPKVAIVVPCFNEAKTLAGTVRSLLALEYPEGKLEVIIVDDGSTDETLAIAQSFEATAPLVRVFHKKNGGKHSAMNFALERTDAELIGCLDADSTVEKGGLCALVPVFENPQIAAVTPGIHVREPRTILQHMQKVEYRLSIFNRFIFAGLGSVFITPGPFSIFRTSIIRELGAWRYAHSTEDMEMALRIQAAGYSIANAPNAVVHTSTPATLRALFRQRVRWTYGWLRNAIDYRSMLGNASYGNLGLIILPSALISIAAGIYFFIRVLWFTAQDIMHEITRIEVTGSLPRHFSFDPFYLPTNALLFLVWASVALILVLICTGSFIGTGRRRPPAATPLFLLFYSFLAPLWLCTALVRAAFKTGVRWR